jgi:hypothetical protein
MRAAPLMFAAALLAGGGAARAAAQEPVRVTAELTAARVPVGAPTTLRITVETRGPAPDEIREPRLSADLEIIGSSEFSQTQISVPGGRSRATRRDLVLVARRPGVYRIPPVEVRVEGRTYRTGALDLLVTGSGGSVAPEPGGGPAPGTSNLRMWLEPDTVYVGQQVLLHAEATFGEDARSRQSRPASFDPPAPAGFWVQDVPNPVAVSLRVREGRTVETQTFRRAFFPLEDGSFTFPPARLYYEVRRGFLLTPETRELASDSVRLVVLPLPAAGRPASYAGAVGRLDVRASIEPEAVLAGEAVTITIEVRGVGNVKALPEPRLPEIPNAEVFPPTQDSRVEVVGDEVGGVKRFRWVVVPAGTGTLTIPPIEYSVFNPEVRRYVTLGTDTLRIQVVDVEAPAGPRDTTLAPVRAAPGTEPAGWARSPLFAALQAVPLVLLAAAGAVRRRREAPPGPREHHRRIRGELVLLRRRSDPRRLGDLERLLGDAARCLAGAPPGDPVAGLRQAGRAAAAYDLSRILSRLQVLRYAPEHDEAAADALLDEAAAFVDGLAPPRRRVPWAGAVVLLVAGLLPGSSAAVRADGILFARAAQELEGGDAAAAARLFIRYASANPHDPNGWHNAGIAAYRSGDRGLAVWAWLRGLRIAPRDAGLLHNLEVAGAGPAGARVRPPDRLARGERLVLAAAGWWVLVLGVALRRRSRRAAAALSAVGIVVLFLASAAMLHGSLRPLLVTPLRDGTVMFAGPSIRDADVAALPVGAVAAVRERRDGWLLVEYGTMSGWVERAAVAAP